MEKPRAKYFSKIHSKYIALEVFSYAADSLDDFTDLLVKVNQDHRDLLIKNFGFITEKMFMKKKYCFYCMVID